MPSLPITLTEAAARRISQLCDARGSHGLRVGVRGGGCAGFSYDISLAESPEPGEETIEREGARALIRPEAVMFLLGCEIDYEDGVLESGFRFRNPNVSASCGCGESVSFRVPG